MLIGTHALLPVCGCLTADSIAVLQGRDRLFPSSALWVVAVFGILPDLCSPHIMLEDRHTSIAHSLWFLAAMLPVAAMAGGFFTRSHFLLVSLTCWIATALHLATDSMSGGIAWLYPWRDEVIGDFWIYLGYWIWSDALFVLLTWFLIRMLPHLEARNIRNPRTQDDRE